MKQQRVTIIGSGNVAEAFAIACAEAALEVVQVYARNVERGRYVARLAGAEWCGVASELKPADLYIICVSDSAVAQVAAQLPFAKGAIVAHTAGCGTLEMLPEDTLRAVIYPFQTFTAGMRVDMRRVYLFIEAQDEAVYAQVADFAAQLSDNVAPADALLRSKIHLVGVVASNFVNNMYAQAAQLLKQAGLPFDVVAPLIAQTAAKALASAEPARMQTGPAVRGDSATMERHRQLIGQDRLFREIYDTISENICRIKETSKNL